MSLNWAVPFVRDTLSIEVVMNLSSKDSAGVTTKAMHARLVRFCCSDTVRVLLSRSMWGLTVGDLIYDDIRRGTLNTLLSGGIPYLRGNPEFSGALYLAGAIALIWTVLLLAVRLTSDGDLFSNELTQDGKSYLEEQILKTLFLFALMIFIFVIVLMGLNPVSFLTIIAWAALTGRIL
ncbi:MAG: hypothetical protein Alpg2KO_17070 [Alphaproteobacteria bacterium]